MRKNPEAILAKSGINYFESLGYRVIDKALDKNANQYYDYFLSI